MRRLDRELTDPAEVSALLASAQVCCLGLNAQGAPYVVPVSYGFAFEDGALRLYFHGAAQGYKLELMARDARASFCIAEPGELVRAETACSYGYTFGSVLGEGELVLLTDAKERQFALERIMEHYDPAAPKGFGAAALARTAVLCLRVERYSAKAKRG